MSTMSALQAHERGGPEKFSVEQAPIPEFGVSDVLVAVRAAGITFAELDWDLSWTKDGSDRTPVIPAHEFAGVVAACGASVSEVRVGDDVFGLVPFDRDGAAAEFVAVPATNLVGKPRYLTHIQAATVPLAALTSVQALEDRANLRTGERVLILGGTGAVGTIAVQIARELDAEVIATGNPADNGLLNSLGAHRVVGVDDAVFGELRGSVDVILDMIGGDILNRAAAALKPGGKLVTLGAPPPAGLAERLGIDATFFVVESNRAQLARIGRLVDKGSLTPVVSQIFELADGALAYASGRTPRPPGKTVISISQPSSLLHNP